VVLAVLFAACGGGSDDGSDDGGTGAGAAAAGAFPEDATCGAALQVNGALDLRIPASNTSTACATGVSFDSGFSAGFLFVDSVLSHADLVVDDVMAGETGPSFPAALTLAHDDGREWAGENCTAEIDRHEYHGPGELGWTRYRVAGRIACDRAATDPNGSAAELDLQWFSFVATIHWN
jgi:hypothetical protein